MKFFNDFFFHCNYYLVPDYNENSFDLKFWVIMRGGLGGKFLQNCCKVRDHEKLKLISPKNTFFSKNLPRVC